MNCKRQGASFAAALVASMLGMPPTAVAFELFGIRLWGSEEADGGIEIIDPLPFAVELSVEGGSDGLESALKNASSLWSNRDTPASGRGGLIAQARGDYRRILAALYGEAFYGGEISILLDGREAAELSLEADFPSTVPVRIRVSSGPRFRFGVADVVNPPPALPEDEGVAAVADPVMDAFRPGERANARVVTAASEISVLRWREAGHPKAVETERDVVADHTVNRLDARIVLDPGRAARFGETRVEGTRRVDPGFVAFMADIPPGRKFDPDRIAMAEQRLSRLGVFRSIRITEAEAIAPDGTLDMTVRVEDRAPRTIGFGGTISTLDGLGVEAYWQHRNLFGRAERLRFDVSASGLGVSGSSSGDVDYSAGVSFLKPGVIGPPVDFIASLTARQLDLDTYRERSITATAGLQRTFARNLNGEISAFVTRARFEDFFGTRDFMMYGLSGSVDVDRRDDTLEPTRGYFLQAEIRPFYEAEFGNFATGGSLEGRTYRAFGETRALVLAARGKVGVFAGPDESESPPDQLLFAGGAGSVRGYAFRSIGIETTEDGETGTVGGRSLIEASGEVRYRINDRFGAVGFLDAGFVSSSTTFGGDADSGVLAGAGLGVRYYTGLGPLRVDVAAPLDKRDDDSAVALYIGIGQSF